MTPPAAGGAARLHERAQRYIDNWHRMVEPTEPAPAILGDLLAEVDRLTRERDELQHALETADSRVNRAEVKFAAADAARATLRQQIVMLVETWEDSADADANSNTQYASGLYQCADELSRCLADLVGAEKRETP